MMERSKHLAPLIGGTASAAIATSAAASLCRAPSSATAFCAAALPVMIGVGALTGAANIAVGSGPTGLMALGAAAGAMVLRWSRQPRSGGVPPNWHAVAEERKEPRPTVRVFSANLWNGADNVESIAREVAGIDPDVVILQELTPRHEQRFRQLETFSDYPFRATKADPSHAGLGVWSRLEMADAEWFEVAGEPQLRTWIRVPDDEPMRLYAVHSPAPVPGKVCRWRQWFAEIRTKWCQEAPNHHGVGLIVGDFNATLDHYPFRALLNCGLQDAALRAHKGWRPTWPTRWTPLPPVFRIDHVLLGPRIDLRTYAVHRGGESDHRSLMADLAVCR